MLYFVCCMSFIVCVWLYHFYVPEYRHQYLPSPVWLSVGPLWQNTTGGTLCYTLHYVYT